MIVAIIGMLLVAIGIWLIMYVVSEEEGGIDEEEIYREEEKRREVMEMMKELGGDEIE